MYKSNATPSKTFYSPLSLYVDNLIDLTVRPEMKIIGM